MTKREIKYHQSNKRLRRLGVKRMKRKFHFSSTTIPIKNGIPTGEFLEKLVAEGKMVKSIINGPDGYTFTCYDYVDNPFKVNGPIVYE